jgi:hypothetical protein
LREELAMTIEERFEKLEKEVKTLREQKGRLRRLSLASIALALAAFVGGTVISVRAYTAVIEPLGVITQNILLKDSAGKVRVALNSSGQLSLYDANGKVRVWLDATGGVVAAQDANGTTRASLGSDGTIASRDSAGRTRAVLSGNEVKTFDTSGNWLAGILWDGNIYLRDSNGKFRLSLSQNYVMLRDSNGTDRVLLSGSDYKLYFRNSSGQTVASYP